METIRNYLENMFLNYPNTAEVLRAKDELWQMMEDKYNELKEEGKTENEIVGTIISEFGNLEELADVIGLQKQSAYTTNFDRQMIREAEAKSYITDMKKIIWLRAFGVMILILSMLPPAILDGTRIEYIGNASFIAIIAMGVALLIIQGTMARKWDYLKHGHGPMDYETTRFVRHELKNFRFISGIMITIGTVLCICSVIPSILLEGGVFNNIPRLENAEGGCFLFCVAIAVFLFIIAGNRIEIYEFLLKKNGDETIAGKIASEGQVYSNKTVANIMSVFWPTVTCIYLSISFLTFQWWITWVIWPIASIVRYFIILFAEKE